MQISPTTLKTTPFQIGPIGINVLHNAVPHIAHDPADRVNQTLNKLPNGVYAVTFANNPAGDTIFLPFQPDQIRSIELPANPGPGGATKFLTANLDGCCMFIDVKNNGNIVVYHANASTGVTPTPQQSATMPTFQTPACLAQLDALYNTASAHYNGAPTTLHVAFKKARYLRDVAARLQHKANTGRTGVQFGGTPEHGSLTTFAGFFRSGRWEFWFQTYSQFLYQRPATHWKARVGHGTVNPHVTNDPYEVVEAGMYFRAP